MRNTTLSNISHAVTPDPRFDIAGRNVLRRHGSHCTQHIVITNYVNLVQITSFATAHSDLSFLLFIQPLLRRWPFFEFLALKFNTACIMCCYSCCPTIRYNVKAPDPFESAK